MNRALSATTPSQNGTPKAKLRSPPRGPNYRTPSARQLCKPKSIDLHWLVSRLAQ
jgi:hypothetical protein